MPCAGLGPCIPLSARRAPPAAPGSRPCFPDSPREAAACPLLPGLPVSVTPVASLQGAAPLPCRSSPVASGVGVGRRWLASPVQPVAPLGGL